MLIPKELEMKSLLILGTLFLGSLVFASIATAQMQGESQGPMMQTENAQAVAQILNLSPQQKAQLEPILQAEAPKVKAILTDPSLSPSEKKKQLKTVHSQTDPLVKSILNPTQYNQWETIRKNQLKELK
jgi:periplasmic protein CpxP/Spy